jgi:hypothetical protein
MSHRSALFQTLGFISELAEKQTMEENISVNRAALKRIQVHRDIFKNFQMLMHTSVPFTASQPLPTLQI